MTTESIVCGTCAAAVPYGRLSCQSCGELLASVSGGRRVASAAVAPTATPAVRRDVGSTPAATVAEAAGARRRTRRARQAELPWGAADAAAHASSGPGPMPAPAHPADPSPANGHAEDDGLFGVQDDAEPLAAARPKPVADDPDDDRDVGLPMPAGPIPSVLADVPPEPTWAVAGYAPATTSAPPAPAAQLGAAAAATAAAAPAFGTMPSVATPPPPGAYLPPIPAQPAGPPAPARAWAGHDGDAAAAPATGPTAAGSVTVDRARVAEFTGWLSVAGSALAAVGFLLPWSDSVIGASGVGYFDRWGLAGPLHVFVVLGLLAVLALALTSNPIPLWVRVGLPGLGLGALLLGLVWPYLLGPLGSSAGVLIVSIGAACLGVAGLLALVGDRHAGVDRAV
jgi:hypothetical protein